MLFCRASLASFARFKSAGKKFSAALHIMSKAARSFSRRNRRAGAVRHSIWSQIVATDRRARKVSGNALARESRRHRAITPTAAPDAFPGRVTKTPERSRRKRGRFSADFRASVATRALPITRSSRGGELSKLDCARAERSRRARSASDRDSFGTGWPPVPAPGKACETFPAGA